MPVGTDFLLEEMRHLSLQKEIWYQLWQMEVDSSLPVQQEMLYKALVASQSDGKRQRETLMAGEKLLVTGSSTQLLRPNPWIAPGLSLPRDDAQGKAGRMGTLCLLWLHPISSWWCRVQLFSPVICWPE